MRKYLSAVLTAAIVSTVAHADTLAVRRASRITPAAVRQAVPAAEAIELSGHHAPVSAGCSSCQSTGSLDQYPGTCCGDDRSGCCAGLWQNYCQQKKPCWSPSSPRRCAGAGGCGCDFLQTPCLTGNCRARGSACDAASGCAAAPEGHCPTDLAAESHTYGIPSSGDLQPASPLDLPVTPAETAEPRQQLEAAPADVPPAPPEPEANTSAKRPALPFGLNSPNRSRGFPFETAPSAKRSQFPFAR